MSAEDAILYRKINDDWYVMGYGFTFAEAEYDDGQFAIHSEIVEESELFQTLQRLSDEYYTEHGICYAGEYVSDPPAIVPEEHRLLCCLPDSSR